MSFWKQAIGILALVALTVVGWALYVPAARPLLAAAGLAGPLQRAGLLAAPSEAAGTGAPGGGGQAGNAGGGPVRVIAALPVEETLVIRVEAIGTARGVRSVNIAAEISGRIASLETDSGAYIESGAPLVRLDSAEAQIALDRATIALADARRSFDRLQTLNQSGSATDLQLQQAELALREAELQRREAELVLSHHRITAPITGWVGILAVEAGDLVTPGSAIATIEDRSTLLVDFRVPERVANLLKPEDAIRAAPVSDPAQTLTGRISALDNRVDEASRSLRVQARVPNDGDRMRPGMAIVLSLDVTGGRYPAVDPLSIQWAAEGAYVWVLRDGKAQRQTVRILQRNADAVLVEATFAPGDLVVVEGVMALRPGTDAVAAEAGAAETAKAASAVSGG